MITTGIGAGSYPEPDWCYEDAYEQTFNEVIDCDLEDEDYDDWYVDEYHDLMMIGEIE